ncbi:MAG: NADH dehydrogenase [Verrucomicrobia bacterium GWF2_51_19]|nr:MAG: NADH dehydrogenase [Verrucomicrobia bacterium GWF2_51_19]
MKIEDLKQIKTSALARKQGCSKRACICMGSACIASGSKKVKESLDPAAAKEGIEVQQIGCQGLCSSGPIMVTEPGHVLHTHVGDNHVDPILQEIKTGAYGPKAISFDSPFYKKQKRIVLENAGKIDPERIEDYIGQDGYFALAKVLSEYKPEQVIEVIKSSGLRGRGGAGFPTGIKWTLMAQSKSADGRKFVICNGDEGDPGAFMDRSVMEDDPHRILEGMLIAGYAVGANNGFIYVRAEYPFAVERLNLAIEQAREKGLLGKNILESGFAFDIQIRLGAGAFVCGEETALIASIEGKRGSPRPRPPFPTTSGLWGCPTMINNVETLANIAPIIRNGAPWFSAIGVGKSVGTKVFALTGNIVNTGLIEVPMGMTLREIIFDIGGGCPKGLEFKAVQTGGPSGGLITKDYLDTPITYEHLQELGSIMGSGGMVVLTDKDCMVDLAKFYLNFCVDESCGKCAPCRVGGYQMAKILDKITKGRGVIEDLALLEEIALAMKKASLCGLGQTAPNPVLSTLRYFRNEYMAYIEGGAKYARQKAKELAEKAV